LKSIEANIDAQSLKQQSDTAQAAVSKQKKACTQMQAFFFILP
jgi:hypothetical protein